jgi:hypothetical protein
LSGKSGQTLWKSDEGVVDDSNGAMMMVARRRRLLRKGIAMVAVRTATSKDFCAVPQRENLPTTLISCLSKVDCWRDDPADDGSRKREGCC